MKKFTLMFLGAIMAMAVNATTTRLADEADLVAVTPPADLEATTYRMDTYVRISKGDSGWGWEQVSNKIQIGFDGSDVYLQGFSYYLPEAWIKGTLSDDHSTVSFAMQYMGDITLASGAERELYFWPIHFTGEDQEFEVIDAVFNYNEEMGILVLQQDVLTHIFENTLTDGPRYVAQYDTQITIGDDEDTVEVPDDLETTTYVMTADYMGMEDDGTWFEGDDYAGSVKVAVEDDAIYIQGLCQYLPNAWVKGTRDGNTFTLESGQYFGIYIKGGVGYPMYFVGYDAETDEPVDVVFEYNEEMGILYTDNWIGLSSTADDVLAYDILANVVIMAIEDVAAVPETPEILECEYEDYEDEGLWLGVYVPAFSVDGDPLLIDKLYYQVYVDYGDGPEPYVFTTDWYETLEDDAVEIPYAWEDENGIIPDEEEMLLVLWEVEEGVQRVGLQSIYYGGDEENRSEIAWLVIDDSATGISTLDTDNAPATVYFDLQGRRVGNEAKGLLMKQTRTADGQVRTVKVMR